MIFEELVREVTGTEAVALWFFPPCTDTARAAALIGWELLDPGSVVTYQDGIITVVTGDGRTATGRQLITPLRCVARLVFREIIVPDYTIDYDHGEWFRMGGVAVEAFGTTTIRVTTPVGFHVGTPREAAEAVIDYLKRKEEE